MSRRENMPYEGQSLQGIFQNFSAYFQDDPSGPQTVRVLCKKELDTSTTSINSYVNYRKKVNNNLAKINSNISEMLMESFKGIDSICSKVRDCISEFHPPDPQKCAENHLPEISMQKPTYTESFADDARTQMLRRRERDQTFKEIGIKPDLTVKLNTAKEKTERPISQTDCKQKDNLDISKPKYQEMSTSYLEDRSSQYDEASIYEEKIKETSQINDANTEHHDSDGSSCLIESVASEDKIKVDDTCIDEEIRPDEDNKTVTDINTQEEEEEEEEENESKQLCNPADIGEGGKAEDISEITEISVTSEALYPEKRVKKSKIDRKRRHRQRKVLKEYRDALRNEVDNTDFNSLQQIIQNLTERIDILSNASKEVPAEETSLRGSQRELIKQSIRQAKREARRKTNRHRKSENEDYDYNDITKDDGNILKGPKSITSFLGTILTSALEKKLNDDAQGKPKHNLTEVYHRPAITNLHKRLIAQLEANDSFLCLQKLLGKQKKDKDVNKSVFSRINIPLLNIPQPNVKAEKLKMIKTDKMDMLEDPPSQKSNLRSKYADSLWFGERKMFKLNKNSSQTNLDPRKRKKLKERTRLGESGKISSIQIKPMTNYSSTNPNATDNKCGAASSESLLHCILETIHNRMGQTKKKREKMKPSSTVIDFRPIHSITNYSTKFSTISEKNNTMKNKSVYFKSKSQSFLKTRGAHSMSPVVSKLFRTKSYNAVKSKNNSSSRDIANKEKLLKTLESKYKILQIPSKTYSKKTNKMRTTSKPNIERTTNKITPTQSKTNPTKQLPPKGVKSARDIRYKRTFFDIIPSNKQLKLENKKTELQTSKNPVYRCGVTVSNENRDNIQSTTVKTRVHWMRQRNDGQGPLRKLEYLDILDDLTHKDLLPLRSEYPRKDQELDEAFGVDQSKTIQDTYLWKMMYGKEKNDTVWTHLIQPNVECVDRECNICTRPSKEKWQSVDDRLSPRIKPSMSRSKSVIFEGSVRSSLSMLNQQKSKSKRKVIEKLAPYLFDPKEERNNQTLIVMPVRVFYDNYNNPTNISGLLNKNNADPPTVISKASKKPTVPKLPLAVKAALKEAKANKSGKKSPPLVKPKRVICSFQGKEGKEGESIRAIRFNSARVERSINEPEKEQGFKKESKSMTQKDFSNFNSSTSESKPTELNDPQQLAYKKAIMRNLNRMVKIHEPKDDLQRALIKSSPKSPNKKLHDKLTYLRGTNPVTLTQNIEKQDQKSEVERKNINKFSIFNSSGNRKPTSLEMKAAVEKRIAELKPAIEKREAEKFEFTDQKSDRERKLLSFKYGKSIGDQLVSFLNNQPASPDLLIPPLNIHQMNMPRYTPSLGRYTNQNANMGGLPKIDSDRSSSSPVKTAASSPTKTALSSPVKTVNANPRHRQVLMHLRGLKQKNNQIQSNIQKAIEVIETKMVDILSCPGDNTNVEAFDVMEKEITNVLDLMKFTSPSGNRKGGKQLLEHEFETISKELFSKLERILDSEQSVDHTSASETEKESPRSKIKEKTLSNIISTSKLQQSSSATTISHENIHQPRRSSKQRSKSPLHKVKSDTLTNLQPAEMSLSNAEKYIVGEHTTFNEHTANGHVFDKKEDIEKNHGDQLDIEEEPVTRDTENECESLEAKKIEQEELDVILDTEAQLARLEKLLRGDLSNGEDEISIAKDTLTEALEHEKENERFLLQIESSIRTEPNALSNIEEIDSQEHISYGDEIKSEQESFPNMGNLTPSIWAISQGARVQEYNLQVIPSKEKVEDGDVPSTPRTGGLSATTSNEHISERLSEQLSEQKSDQEFSEPEQQISEPEQHFSEPEQQFSEPEPLELEPVSKLKIFTEVPSGDDQISSGAEEYMTPQHTSQEVSPRENNLESLEEVQNRLLPASEGSNSNLNDQVDQIIQRVEDIYAHLDDIQEGKEVPVFREGHKPFKIPSKEFLTPFMQAVKDKRTNNPDGTNTLEGTASYYNILHFLDTLNELQIEKAQEVHTARLYKYARVCNIPNVVHQATIEYPIHSKISEKPSCLKKCDDSKNKNKKVSFLVLKENKEAQVTMCPYHNKVKCIKVSTGQHSPDEDEFHIEGTTLISRKRPETIPEEPSDVSRSEKLEKPKELPKPKEAPNYVNKEVQNVDESKNIQVDSFESSEFTGDSSEPTETEDSYITATNTPKVEVNYNTSEESIPQIIHKKNQISGYYGTRSILHIRNRSNVRSKIKPNLVIFKKVNMSDLLKRPKDIERFSDMQMKPAAKNTFTNFKQDNVGFLKSFYAIMYILVFTALNMEYKCY